MISRRSLSAAARASLKWDAWSRRGHAADELPLWVADMDFKTVPAAIEALTERVAHGVFGYSMAPDGYYEAVQGWFERRHGWRRSASGSS